MSIESLRESGVDESVTLLLCGDVMTGRGIDQILPHPASPELYEPYVRDARNYVRLAEHANGEISYPVSFDYIWGDTLRELERFQPEIRLINLETAVTRHDTPWPHKGINYRMHPDNIPCLTAAGVQCCALANNHVLDWHYGGFKETLATLKHNGIAYAGAANTLADASRPAELPLAGGSRLLVWSFGLADSGIPREWRAKASREGVYLLDSESEEEVEALAQRITAEKRDGDIALISVHWGSNWGYEIPAEHQRLAQHLVDAGADIIHGHSSHHPKGMELYHGKPILYGCGDLINDYEGIGGHEGFYPDLALLFFCRWHLGRGEPGALWMTPLRRRRFALEYTGADDASWLRDTLNQVSLPGSPTVTVDNENRLHWLG
ncbi:capsule biosynthesis protein [Litchfieldella qijiaojingensis]|uniref:Capsule biosynthesis protein n=1 Tax=Litchfieldella qijiaojingensis TaxID=980347 RepID=A0ABQ2YVP3_9GAMM|nr:CapA family protein [Halomonas qijiaojingensis]GGX95492.1 capsule biosynthesis protein [Halomonas qijiaojingensis]